MSPALLLGVVLVVHPTVASSTNCPSSRDIASNLAVLLSEDAAQAGTALVTPSSDGLLVDLRPENPAFGAQRSVVVGSDCQERAKAAAVVIATWWPVGPTGTTQAKAIDEVRSPDGRPRRFAACAGSFASLVSRSAAPGGRVEAAWAPWGSALGFRLSLAGTASHTADLGQGQVHFTRASVELGPTYARGALSLDAGFVVSRFWIEGSGFAVNQSSTGASVGATTGLRLGWTWGPTRTWLELRGMWWPQFQRIYITEAVTNARTVHPMPRGELQLGAGMSFSLF